LFHSKFGWKTSCLIQHAMPSTPDHDQVSLGEWNCVQ
jgi:hypothetical protein